MIRSRAFKPAQDRYLLGMSRPAPAVPIIGNELLVRSRRMAWAAFLAVSAALSSVPVSPAGALDLFATHEVTTQFATPDGKPMANAEVRVFAPGDPNKVALTGRTDADGKFVFDADRDGFWSAEARGAGLCRSRHDPRRRRGGAGERAVAVSGNRLPRCAARHRHWVSSAARPSARAASVIRNLTLARVAGCERLMADQGAVGHHRGGFAGWVIVYALAIVYASLVVGPTGFHFVPLSPETAWHMFKATPYLLTGSDQRPDWMANLLMLVPLGWLATGAFWPRRDGLRWLAAGAALCCCLILVLRSNTCSCSSRRAPSRSIISRRKVSARCSVSAFFGRHATAYSPGGKDFAEVVELR